MQRNRLFIIITALAICGFLAAPAQACRIIDPRPIIIIHPPHPMPEPVPIQIRPLETRSHAAEITIDGQAATVTLEAVFFNPNGQQLEGVMTLVTAKFINGHN